MLWCLQHIYAKQCFSIKTVQRGPQYVSWDRIVILRSHFLPILYFQIINLPSGDSIFDVVACGIDKYPTHPRPHSDTNVPHGMLEPPALWARLQITMAVRVGQDMSALLDRVGGSRLEQGWGGRGWSLNQGGYNEDLPCLANSATWDMSADQITYFTLKSSQMPESWIERTANMSGPLILFQVMTFLLFISKLM